MSEMLANRENKGKAVAEIGNDGSKFTSKKAVSSTTKT